MQKIKISSIVLLVILGIFFVFINIIFVWLGLTMALISLFMLILLNIEAFKTRGIIKKIIIYTDTTFILMILLTLVPQESEFSLVSHYSIDSLLLVFTGFLISILVNVYKEEK